MSKKVGLIITFLIFLAAIAYISMQEVRVLSLSGSVSINRQAGGYLYLLDYGFEQKVNAKIVKMYRLSYTASNHGKPKITRSKILEMPDIVNLTIVFSLTTPSNKTIMFEPLKLGKGGVHNFTLVLGPDEGVSGNGRFNLTIMFSLKVTTPAGITIVEIHKAINVVFQISGKNVEIFE
ncbi:MAG: hypothetical protein ACP6IP_10030 [Candidatus Njordarchaeia archaeon]